MCNWADISAKKTDLDKADIYPLISMAVLVDKPPGRCPIRGQSASVSNKHAFRLNTFHMRTLFVIHCYSEWKTFRVRTKKNPNNNTIQQILGEFTVFKPTKMKGKIDASNWVPREQLWDQGLRFANCSKFANCTRSACCSTTLLVPVGFVCSHKLNKSTVTSLTTYLNIDRPSLFFETARGNKK